MTQGKEASGFRFRRSHIGCGDGDGETDKRSGSGPKKRVVPKRLERLERGKQMQAENRRAPVHGGGAGVRSRSWETLAEREPDI
jgi:hypothetical protein